MDKKESRRPGPATAEETENADRQPGRKGHPHSEAPSPRPSGKTGTGERPPNNSAPGTGSVPTDR